MGDPLGSPLKPLWSYVEAKFCRFHPAGFHLGFLLGAGAPADSGDRLGAPSWRSELAQVISPVGPGPYGPRVLRGVLRPRPHGPSSMGPGPMETGHKEPGHMGKLGPKGSGPKGPGPKEPQKEPGPKGPRAQEA